jgi:hypothetical protein
MFFQRKIQRVLKTQGTGAAHSTQPEKLEKGDLPAMLLAALIVFLPALLLLLGLFCGVLWLCFLR